jgi:LmbE family N-acetylglucosaminyl deacetylase
MSSDGSFGRFTGRARKVLTLAREEARRFNHGYIGTEHLLLGLVREGDGDAAKVLSNLGVDLQNARSAVEIILGRGEPQTAEEIGLTSRAKKVIELAVNEARRLESGYVGTEHLLLGLIREDDSGAVGVLESLGVTLEKVRADVMKVLCRAEPDHPPNRTHLLPVPEDWSQALSIVAHPDDLEYGSASAVAKWVSQGKFVAYVIATRGEAGIDGMKPEDCGPLRMQEEINSAAVVGVNDVVFLDHQDGAIEYGLALRRDIARVVRQFRPDVIISLNRHESWGGQSWNTPDHRAVGTAAIDGARDAGNRWIFRELLDEGLEPWSGAKMVLFNGSPTPTHYVDVTGFLDKGIASLQEHEAYIKGLGGDFDPDAFLRQSAEGSGKDVGCDHAVTFEVIQL